MPSSRRSHPNRSVTSCVTNPLFGSLHNGGMANPTPRPRGYTDVPAAAAYTGRSPATITEWARRERVPSQRHSDGTLLVDFVSVARYDEAAPRRNGGRNRKAADACRAWMEAELARQAGLNAESA